MHGIIEDERGAVTENLHVVLREIGGVPSALAVFDHGAIRFTPRAESRGCAVEIDGVSFGQVRDWAVNPFAISLVFGVAVVEAAEPHGAHVSSEGPLTNPDRVLHRGSNVAN